MSAARASSTALYSPRSSTAKDSLHNLKPEHHHSHHPPPPKMPGTAIYNAPRARDGARPDWESIVLRVDNITEKVTAAKGLVSLRKDEDELFDSCKKGFGPLYPTATETADPLDISAAQTLIAISHQIDNDTSLFDRDGNRSAGNPENAIPFRRNYYPEDNSGNAHYAAREVIAAMRDTAGRAGPAYPMPSQCPSYYHSGDTTDDDSELDDSATSENEAHTGSTSVEEVVLGNPIVLAVRPSIKLTLPACPSPNPKTKVLKKVPKSPPKARERKAPPKGSRKKKPTAEPRAPPQPTRRSARMQKRRAPFAGMS
jgi:hypothetical protein